MRMEKVGGRTREAERAGRDFLGATCNVVASSCALLRGGLCGFIFTEFCDFGFLYREGKISGIRRFSSLSRAIFERCGLIRCGQGRWANQCRRVKFSTLDASRCLRRELRLSICTEEIRDRVVLIVNALSRCNGVE